MNNTFNNCNISGGNFGNPHDEGYNVLLNDVANSTTQTDALSVEIPGGEWPDGGVIEIQANSFVKNNSGGTAVLHVALGVNGDQETLLSNYIESSPNIKSDLKSIRLGRVGNTIYHDGYTTSGSRNPSFSQSPDQSPLTPFKDGDNLTYDFSQPVTISIKATWSIADANICYSPQWATAKKLHE
jgi:hypothetical protein